MKPVKLTIKIETIDVQKIGCYISDASAGNHLNYLPAENSICFAVENYLAGVVRKNQLQFEKVIRSALKGDLKIGQTINCVFLEGFPFLNDSDFYHFIRVDRRNGKLKISTSKTGTREISKIYADGSFAGETRQAGYGGFTIDTAGRHEIFNQSFNEGSNNLMELLAVTEGLKRLAEVEKIQVNTDSRFVIRGLMQWVHFWRHNNWQTAYGKEVKFAESWQETDKLCDGKFVEFRWIKGHSGNEAQDFCHKLAKQSATRITGNDGQL